MKLSTFEQRIVGNYKSGHCMYLISKPGRGKTAIISKAPAIIGAALGLNIGFSYMSGPLLNPPDTIGYLVPTKDIASGHPVSFYTKPFWWFTREGKPLEAYDGGIIFIDEADKMDVDMKKVAGEGAISGRFGPHQLPPGWVVWMAGNTKDDRSGSTKELDHLINRRCEIVIEDDFDGWMDWAASEHLNPVALAFAADNINVIFNDTTPKDQGPWCTPRSFVECIRHLEYFAGPDGRLPVDPAAQQEAAGFIGKGAAHQLFATIQLEHELPKLEDILASPLTAYLPTRADAQMLVIYSLAARANHDNLGPMMDYVARLPREFDINFAKTVNKANADLLNHPAVDKWMEKNASLVQMILRFK